MLRCPWLNVRRLNVQRGKIGVHLGDHAIGQIVNTFTVFIGTFDDLVINIGDIAHVVDLVAAVTQVARHGIKGHEGSAVTNVTEVVNGNATHVHANFTGMNRFELLFLTTQGVINL